MRTIIRSAVLMGFFFIVGCGGPAFEPIADSGANGNEGGTGDDGGSQSDSASNTDGNMTGDGSDGGMMGDAAPCDPATVAAACGGANRLCNVTATACGQQVVCTCSGAFTCGITDLGSKPDTHYCGLSNGCTIDLSPSSCGGNDDTWKCPSSPSFLAYKSTPEFTQRYGANCTYSDHVITDQGYYRYCCGRN